jgi:cardiolipin synthase
MPGGRTDSATYTRHNRVQMVHGGGEYFRIMEEMIDSANSTIHLQVYIYDGDETGRKIGVALKRAAARGLKVYLLVDGYASKSLDEGFIEELRSGSVHFSFFEPFIMSQGFYVGRRMHHKVLVIDGYEALVGGINISDRYNDLNGRAGWLDWAVRATGEIAPKLDQYCVDMWNGFGEREDLAKVTGSVLKIDEVCLVRMRRNDWVNRKTEVYRSYMQLFTDAKENVTLMSSYFWPGRKMLRRMAAASRRGVNVRVMLAGLSDIPIAKSAERYIYRRLFRDNIEVYEYQDNILHGKVAVADNCFVTIGSYNVNNISAYASLELNLDIKDDNFAASVNRELDAILRKDCIRITEESFTKKYHFFQRLWQQIAFDVVHIIFFLFTFYFRQKEAKRISRAVKE